MDPNSGIDECKTNVDPSQPMNKRDLSTAELNSDCNNMYGPTMVVREETEALLAESVQQLKKEMDQLPGRKKQAYVIAIEQEIKLRTHYIREDKFLLMFLRKENFNIAKAAMRFSKFLEIKLNLFGAEKLPCRITLNDLSDTERNILISGFLDTNCGEDCCGRRVQVIRRSTLYKQGYLQESFSKSIQRAFFYKYMSLLEKCEQIQKKGFVSVVWKYDRSVPLKVYRKLIGVVKMMIFALPVKLTGSHLCSNKYSERLTIKWTMSFFPKDVQARTKFHYGTPVESLIQLSKYGIDINMLPIKANGEINGECIIFKAKQEMERHRCRESNLYSIKIRGDCKQATKLSSAPQVLQESTSKSELLLANPNQHCTVDSKMKKPNFAIKENSSSHDKFPLRLMRSLDNNASIHAIWWLSCGSAFAINVKKFSAEVLINEFEGLKFSSFLRTLRRWGFKKLIRQKKNSEIVMFCHPLFQKNSPELLHQWDCYNSNANFKKKQIDNCEETSNAHGDVSVQCSMTNNQPLTATIRDVAHNIVDVNLKRSAKKHKEDINTGIEDEARNEPDHNLEQNVKNRKEDINEVIVGEITNETSHIGNMASPTPSNDDTQQAIMIEVSNQFDKHSSTGKADEGSNQTTASVRDDEEDIACSTGTNTDKRIEQQIEINEAPKDSPGMKYLIPSTNKNAKKLKKSQLESTVHNHQSFATIQALQSTYSNTDDINNTLNTTSLFSPNEQIELLRKQQTNIAIASVACNEQIQIIRRALMERDNFLRSVLHNQHGMQLSLAWGNGVLPAQLAQLQGRLHPAIPTHSIPLINSTGIYNGSSPSNQDISCIGAMVNNVSPRNLWESAFSTVEQDETNSAQPTTNPLINSLASQQFFQYGT